MPSKGLHAFLIFIYFHSYHFVIIIYHFSLFFLIISLIDCLSSAPTGEMVSKLIAEVADGSSNVREVWKLSLK